jgi:predicted RNA binding protein YcfA (HicA-like mRNA interferase family)
LLRKGVGLSMTVKVLIQKLEANGWTLKATRGSHMQYTHPQKPGKVTIANHKGDIPPGTLNSILKQAGLK